MPFFSIFSRRMRSVALGAALASSGACAWAQAASPLTQAPGYYVQNIGQLQVLALFDGVEAGVDRTDGLRMTLADGRIVHLRPSGNAPELRFYAEADSVQAAQNTLATGLAALAKALT